MRLEAVCCGSFAQDLCTSDFFGLGSLGLMEGQALKRGFWSRLKERETDSPFCEAGGQARWRWRKVSNETKSSFAYNVLKQIEKKPFKLKNKC